MGTKNTFRVRKKEIVIATSPFLNNFYNLVEAI